MKEETKFLIEIADRFDDDAQDVLDFVAKSGNLEKAAKALAGAGMPTIPTAAPAPAGTPAAVPGISSVAPEALDKIPDGVYFIAGGTEGEINTKTYAKYDPSMTAAPFPTKYIGVKLGHRTVAVALEDMPGDKDGELQLLPRDHTSPETSEHYTWNDEANEYQFNAFEDFDGKGNTERLKEYGSKIEVPEGEWIPSMGELALLMMHATEVNRAIELAGGKPIKGWHWSSTEVSQGGAWYVYFSYGYASTSLKHLSYAVRAVAAF